MAESLSPTTSAGSTVSSSSITLTGGPRVWVEREAPNNFLSSKNGTSVRPTRRGIRGGGVGYYVTADPVSGRRCRGREDVSACWGDIRLENLIPRCFAINHCVNYDKFGAMNHKLKG